MSAGTLHVLGRSTHRSLPVSHPPWTFRLTGMVSVRPKLRRICAQAAGRPDRAPASPISAPVTVPSISCVTGSFVTFSPVGVMVSVLSEPLADASTLKVMPFSANVWLTSSAHAGSAAVQKRAAPVSRRGVGSTLL